jgi:hypothetical protein
MRGTALGAHARCGGGVLLSLVADARRWPSRTPAREGVPDVQVPVALAQSQPADERIYGKLCTPSGCSPNTIQLPPQRLPPAT